MAYMLLNLYILILNYIKYIILELNKYIYH